jgi:hypothetical protein
VPHFGPIPTTTVGTVRDGVQAFVPAHVSFSLGD